MPGRQCGFYAGGLRQTLRLCWRYAATRPVAPRAGTGQAAAGARCAGVSMIAIHRPFGPVPRSIDDSHPPYRAMQWIEVASDALWRFQLCSGQIRAVPRIERGLRSSGSGGRAACRRHSVDPRTPPNPYRPRPCAVAGIGDESHAIALRQSRGMEVGKPESSTRTHRSHRAARCALVA